MAVTIKDVARQANVTIGTVSRALNGYKDIKPETKENILQIAHSMGYTPNVSARNLSSKTTSSIGLIVSGLLEGNRKDNSVFEILQGVYRYALGNGLEVVLYTTDSAGQRSKSYAKFCEEHNLAGAILGGVTTDDAYFTELRYTNIPCVVVDTPVEGDAVGWLSIDNIQASEEIADYLLQKGHRRIVVVSGKKNAAVNLERTVGAFAAMKKAGLTLTGEDVLYCNFSEEQAYEKVMEYLEENGKGKCTAFLCFSDLMALGAMRAVRDSGFCIPEDFSVTGFDNLPITEYFMPPLTTVSQDREQMGYSGAMLLHGMIQGKTSGGHRMLPYRLVERGSVRDLSQK